MPRREAPYKGLMPYDEEDAEYFFGRDSQRDIIIANLIASRLTLLYGPSGVGKSSVLRAGVAHQLRKQIQKNLSEQGSPEFGFVVFNSWRDDPTKALQERFAQYLSTLNRENPVDSPAMNGTLVDFLNAWSSRIDGDLYIILDQFEEYFLYHETDRDKASFGEQFVRAVNNPNLRANFLISIREDSLAKLDRFKGRIPKLFENYLRIDHLSRASAAEAIELPVKKYNEIFRADEAPIEIERALIDEVLGQVRAGKLSLGDTGVGVVKAESSSGLIETPYLQLVMTRLWDEEIAADSKVLRLATLKRLGNAETIVRTHLDKTMQSLTSEEQEVAAQAFHYLVTPSETKIAYNTSDLAKYTSLSKAELSTVLEKLASSNMLILRKVPVVTNPQAPSRFEIFHDVLGKAILDWRSRFNFSREFLKDRLDEEQRASRRRKLLIAGCIAALILTVVFVWLILLAYNQSKRIRSLELSNQANQKRGTPLSLLLAKKALEQMETPKAEKALRMAARDYAGLLTLNHPHAVTTATFTPDGSYIVSGTYYRVYVWHMHSGDLAKSFDSEASGIWKFAVSHDNQLVATAGSDHKLRIFETLTGKKRGEMTIDEPPTGPPDEAYLYEEPHDGRVKALEFSRDDKFVLVAHYNKVVVWDTNSGNTKVLTHKEPFKSARISPRGDSALVVVVESSISKCLLWNWKTTPTSKLLLETTGARAAFNADGSLLAIASDSDDEIRLFDPANGNRKALPNRIVSQSELISFSADGKRLVSFGGDRFRSYVRVWDISNGTIINERPFSRVSRWASVFSPESLSILSSTEDDVRIDFIEGSHDSLVLDQRGAHNLTFGPGGKTALATSGVTARIWKAQIPEPGKAPEETEPIQSLLKTAITRAGREMTADELRMYAPD